MIGISLNEILRWIIGAAGKEKIFCEPLWAREGSTFEEKLSIENLKYRFIYILLLRATNLFLSVIWSFVA